MTADQRYQRWVDQLERIIQEVHNAHLYRHLWSGLVQMTQAAELPPSVIFDALGIWYTSTQGVNVRRQVDRTKGVVSLYRLLDEIAGHPGVVSRDRHVALWDGHDDEVWATPAHENYDRFSGARERNTIDPELVRADLVALVKASSVVEDYVNEAITHAADELKHAVPTYEDLNAAIDEIGRLVQKYWSLLTAQRLATLVPTIHYDWQEPFRQAWLPSGVGSE